MTPRILVTLLRTAIGVSLLFPGLVPAAETADTPTDLHGRITDEAGHPLPNATVFIHSAGPKTGSSVFCPTCYPDCRKRARTGPDGTFDIPALDPNLKFKILLVDKGFEPKLVKDVDPGKRQLNLVLIPRDPTLLTDTNRLSGQVFAPSGQPLAGAVISVESVEKQNQTTQYGGSDRYVDETLVTDDRGYFVGAVYSSEVVQVGAKLEAPGIAPRWISIKPGRDHVFSSDDGVTVTGRIVRDGKGVAGVIVGMTSKSRGAGQGFRDLNARTDADGRFHLDNIPGQHGYLLYTKMKEMAATASLETQTVNTAEPGTTVELGDLGLTKAYTFRGTVILPPGEAVPAKTRIFLGREDAWDSQEALLDEDGNFEFHGVPAESISIGFRIRGFRLSKKNPSLDWLNGRILGKMERDIADFKILIERGDWKFNPQGDADLPPGVEQYPREKPLKSAP